MAISVPATIALSAILVLLTASGEAKNDNNVILSGQTLGTDQVLQYSDPACGKPSANLTVHADCNLVLNGGDWQSNTSNAGSKCTLKLQNNGRLVVTGGDGRVVWRSGASSSTGKYAAVLHPNYASLVEPTQPMVITVYGPAVWSTRKGKLLDDLPQSTDLDHSNPAESSMERNNRVGNSLAVDNLLFSGQILYADMKLMANDAMIAFVMQVDCELFLYANPRWQSNTHSKGKYCFLRLDHNGGLAIVDDSYKTVWTNRVRSKEGSYVGILQPEGDFVIYGPAVWTTAGQHFGASALGDIKRSR